MNTIIIEDENLTAQRLGRHAATGGGVFGRIPFGGLRAGAVGLGGAAAPCRTMGRMASFSAGFSEGRDNLSGLGRGCKRWFADGLRDCK